MELVKLTHENMEKEHICCAISNNKDIQVMSKKNWLKDRLDEGLVILSSKKKMGFPSDLKHMGYKGFQTADTAEPYFELMYLPFGEGASLPRFRDSVSRHEDMPEGFVLYYTNQCLLRQSMCRYWRRWQRPGMQCSDPYISRPGRMRRMPLRPFVGIIELQMNNGRNVDVKTKIDYYSRLSVCGENDSDTETFYFL